MNRIDLGLYSHPKGGVALGGGGGGGGGGLESGPMLTPREKIPSTRKESPQRSGTHDAAPSRTASPTTLPLSYSGPPPVI